MGAWDNDDVTTWQCNILTSFQYLTTWECGIMITRLHDVMIAVSNFKRGKEKKYADFCWPSSRLSPGIIFKQEFLIFTNKLGYSRGINLIKFNKILNLTFYLLICNYCFLLGDLFMNHVMSCTTFSQKALMYTIYITFQLFYRQ